MSKQLKIIRTDNLVTFKRKIFEILNKKADKSEIPEFLPMNGGNADTLNGKTASEFAASAHNHDERYYTETEIDNKLANKADIGALTEIKIGTVTTGAAGSEASASTTTQGTVFTLNLTIPKGDKGDTGAAGATGSTGAKGDKGDKGDPGVHYGTCSTAAATITKVVSITGFSLATGAAVIVNFTVTNTAANPKLNVNSTGAKYIRYRNANIAAGYLAANRTYEFVYDGTYWQLVGDLDIATTGGTISGNLTVTGTITANGNITGAKVYNAVWGADYAEGFCYEGEIPKIGQIVELCGDNKIRVASANSNLVIGVCSNTYWALAGCDVNEILNGSKVAVGIVGQLPIKVRGAVKFGDYIVCVGNGIGEARDSPSIGQIAGRAMESNPSEEIKEVKCIISVH